MTPINIWTILGAATIILLILFWRKRVAVWGSLTMGVGIGFIIAIMSLYKGSGFNWAIIGKGAVLGTMLCFIAKLLGMVPDYLRKKKQ
jgi:hypothetical protein